MQNWSVEFCLWLGLIILCPTPKKADTAAQGATFCQLYQPQYWSANDTRKTKENIDTLNRTWKGLCSGGRQNGNVGH